MSSVCSCPICPYWFSPQHFRTPLSRIAQECLSATLISMAVLPLPRSTVLRWSPISKGPSPMFEVFPMPNWPALFLPQHLTLPSSSSAQVWDSPASI